MNELQIKLNNVVNVKNLNIDVKRLNIVCGDNNIGKSDVINAVYGLFQNCKTVSNLKISKAKLKQLQNNGYVTIDLSTFIKNIKKVLSKNYTKNLHNVFSTHEDFFKLSKVSTDFNISLEKSYNYELDLYGTNYYFEKKLDESTLKIIVLKGEKGITLGYDAINDIILYVINSILLDQVFNNSFIATSDRSSIITFAGILKNRGNTVITEMKKDPENIEYILNKCRYRLSIIDEMNFIGDIGNVTKRISSIDNSKLTEIIDGTFSYNSDIGDIFYNSFDGNAVIPIGYTSSFIQSFVSLYFYTKYVAKKGDMIFIEYPELFLDYRNKVKMIEFVKSLLDSDIDIFITTSDEVIANGFSEFKEKSLIQLN
ncbi:ATP-binding protein [Candidatus Woesearchaeota archaeon]|nr:ATP-binding protein [Candidatus Woesearchaeota archaeon]